MFHRVKSEVQGSEQKRQPEETVNTGYRQATIRQPSDHEEQDDVAVVHQEEEFQVQEDQNTQPTKEEEAHSMRPQQDAAPVQGKYAREEERASEPTRSPASPVSGGYQPSAARGAGYQPASSYNPSSYVAPQAAPYTGSNDRTLTIGRGINMSGEIDACDHLLVEGTVEAALKGAKVLDIAESGTFYGTVEIEEATIAGRFEGDITVNGRLTLKASGVITGSIAYRELEVESGAVIDGRMTPLKNAVDPKSVEKYRAGTEASAMAKSKDGASKKDSREPANTESGLFSKAHAAY